MSRGPAAVLWKCSAHAERGGAWSARRCSQAATIAERGPLRHATAKNAPATLLQAAAANFRVPEILACLCSLLFCLSSPKRRGILSAVIGGADATGFAKLLTCRILTGTCWAGGVTNDEPSRDESMRTWRIGRLPAVLPGAAALSLALAACTVGTRSQVQILHETESILSVVPSREVGYDYLVSIQNFVDPGFNPDDKQTRDRIALARVKKRCPLGEIVSETATDSGQWFGGRPKRTYAIQVKC
jgi:hypothetical protein